jgi:rare lipoprotein A
MRLFCTLLALVLLAGCSGSAKKSSSRYSIKQDHGPSGYVDMSHVPDAVPRYEPRSRGGNKSPYTVWGKNYYVLDSGQGFRERGIASWYGKKFHGHLTSNGETYDMYAMSAAHKALPLPSYVRVTNLDNGKQVVVRVNDRGPFHGGRIIDLSYAAAFRLDMLKKGTARVEIEALTPSDSVLQPATAALSSPEWQTTASSGNRFIQVGAYSSWNSAQSVKTRIGLLLPEQRIDISKRDGVPAVYRVRVGPLVLGDPLEGTQQLLDQLSSEGFVDAQVLDLP